MNVNMILDNENLFQFRCKLGKVTMKARKMANEREKDICPKLGRKDGVFVAEILSGLQNRTDMEVRCRLKTNNFDLH